MDDAGRDFTAGRGLLMDTPDLSAPKPQRGWRFWLGIGLSLVTVYWLVVTTDWQETWSALSLANYWLVLIAVLLAWGTILMRTVRWRLLFPADNAPRLGQLTAVLLIGQAINIIAPARAGDVAKATLVGSESAAFVLGTIVVQSALDLFMLAGFTAFLLFQISLPAWWRDSGQALLFTTLSLLLLGLIFVAANQKIMQLITAVNQRRPHRFGQRVARLLAEFMRSVKMLNATTIIYTLLWSLAIWLVYGLINYILLLAVHAPPSWLASFFLLVVLQLGIAVPSSPGRIGVYHYLSVQSLAVFAIEGATAVSFAIILHFISIILPIILGAGLAWQMNIKLSTSKQS
jgi:uncharacterized protein (TIRG00374 family)